MRLFFVCLIIAAGCSDLIPGMCETQADCKGQTACDLDPKSLDFHKCVPTTDAGTSDAGKIDGPGSPDERAGSERRAPDAMGTCGRNEDCPAANPVCSINRCVECAQDVECKGAGKPFCRGNVCTGCGGAGSGACAMKDLARPVCGATGACVECAQAPDCKDAGKAFCVANACVGCKDAGAGACKAPTGFCDLGSGRCVECTADTQCTFDPNRPFCVANKCEGCAKTSPTACAMKLAVTPVCSPAGACVECITSAHCTMDGARPICEAAKCRRCGADAECVTKLG